MLVKRTITTELSECCRYIVEIILSLISFHWNGWDNLKEVWQCDKKKIIKQSSSQNFLVFSILNQKYLKTGVFQTGQIYWRRKIQLYEWLRSIADLQFTTTLNISVSSFMNGSFSKLVQKLNFRWTCSSRKIFSHCFTIHCESCHKPFLL